jgi:hypothetical protein
VGREELGSGSCRYHFVELKVTSNHPAWAAFEVLLYGLSYLTQRQDEGLRAPATRTAPVFSAEEIVLHVLAPRDFYEGYELH